MRCACGCGRALPFEDLRSKYLPACAQAVRRQRAREYAKARYRADPAFRERKRASQRKIKPWVRAWAMAKDRCLTPSSPNSACYGGRGSKFRLTLPEIKWLWNRDRAWHLKSPSLDRIDNDGDYELSNCRFIEHEENGRLGTKHRHGRLHHGCMCLHKRLMHRKGGECLWVGCSCQGFILLRTIAS